MISIEKFIKKSTKEELLGCIQEAYESLSEILEGKVEYDSLPVQSNMIYWGNIANGVCYVCLAGGRYLKKHGRLISDSDEVYEIESFLNQVRLMGSVSVYQSERTQAIVKALEGKGIAVPVSEDKSYNTFQSDQVLSYVSKLLSLNSIITDQEAVSKPQKRRKPRQSRQSKPVEQ